MTQCRLFQPDEFRAQEDRRRAAVDAWRAEHPDADLAHAWPDELTALSESFFPTGSMWFCPWYHDPADPEDLAKVAAELARPADYWQPTNPNRFLSIHYWRDWARIRPPLIIVGPGGGHFCPDQASSNGTGWTVTGEAPNITVSPSIWLSQGKGAPREYHGFLNAGVFSGPV